MKNIICILIVLISLPLWGQEFSSDISSIDSSENSFDNIDFVDGSFTDEGDSSFFVGVSEGLEISGSLNMPLTIDPNWDSLETSIWSFSPKLITNLDYSGSSTDLRVVLNTKQENEETTINFDEAWVRLYMGNADLEAGLMKIIWGKGDKIHVMDVLNPMDYSQFIEPDYNKRKQADFMVRLNLGIGDTGRAEFVVLPWFTPNIYATEGRWLMSEAATLRTIGETAMESFGTSYYSSVFINNGATSAAAGIAALATSQKLSELENTFIREENTKTLEYAQGGIRFTHTAGPLDWGLAVIRSFVRVPVVKSIDLNTAAITAASDPHIEVSYTPMVMAAQEAALVVKGFNLREEAALTLTEDWKGDDPDLNNSRVEWLFGFDRNAGLNNINLNMQAKGSYLLFTENITTADPEYSNRYYSHMITGSLSGSFFYEILKLSLSGSWNVEDKDFLLFPEIKLTFREAVSFSLIYHLYEGDSDTLFGQFDDKDNLILSCKINF